MGVDIQGFLLGEGNVPVGVDLSLDGERLLPESEVVGNRAGKCVILGLDNRDRDRLISFR
ncbi:hypothetical protein AYO44_11300 [Planctomycetaceae bacterium SCGC AG-212-F19]|nr:hypothetical protein AYO44_11300 [Planctomycetaceae bacterium SCGC AG-212-F19]